MDYLGTLNQLAARFGLSSSGSKLEWEMRLDAPPDALDPVGLGLTEIVPTLTQTALPIAIDLALVGKWVRSGSSDLPVDPALEDPIGGMPVGEQHVLATTGGLTTALPPPSLMTSDPNKATVPGVPEIIGRLKGTVTQTIERITDVVTRHPVHLAVRWRVRDQSTPGVDVPATTVDYQLPGQSSWQRVTEVVLPVGESPAPGAPQSIKLRFPAMFSELKSSLPELMRFRVEASVKLSITPPATGQAVSTGWIDLPSIPVPVPTIPVPTVLVLFEHRDFAGRKLVLVPSDSLLGGAAESGGLGIGPALELVAGALSTLAPGHALLGFLGASGGTLGTAAQALKALSPSPGQTIVAAQSRVDDLSAEAFVFSAGTFGIGRFTGDNMASSMICLGRPGTVFDFFFDTNLVENVTRLQLTLDSRLGCVISKLDDNDPTGDIVFGGRLTSSSPREGHDYEDEISSLALTGPSGRFLPLTP